VRTVSEQALWEDVATGLRNAITAGDYKPGDTLPTEFELAGRYGVSRDTVRRALGRLTQEGLLTPGRGRLGRQVRKSRPLTFFATRSETLERVAQRRAMGADAWVADSADQGRKAGQSIAVAMDEAAPEVASRLQIPEGELVVVRRRLRTIDGEPHNLNDTYYPREIAEGTAIMHPADVTQGTIALMKDLGYEQVLHRDDLETRMPTPDEADQLSIPPGVPVLVQYRTGYTAALRPVKLTITVWPGDRTTLVYEVPA
jgi:GntR family transcriptional regulator